LQEFESSWWETHGYDTVMKDWQAKYGDFMDNGGGEEEEEKGENSGEGSQEGEEGPADSADVLKADSEIKLGSETGTEAWGGPAQAEQSGKGGILPTHLTTHQPERNFYFSFSSV